MDGLPTGLSTNPRPSHSAFVHYSLDEIDMEIAIGILIGTMITGFVTFLANADQYQYSYHVAYSFGQANGVSGFGTMNVKRTRRISSLEEVNNVREFIEKEAGFEKVVILNWVLLK